MGRDMVLRIDGPVIRKHLSVFVGRILAYAQVDPTLKNIQRGSYQRKETHHQGLKFVISG